ncbi:MAG TPA: TlpA disulfide reductase family protein [Verrucomicrobiae bacterium]|nr:TlpA disulfide reductase family protein [Verrucomicrobiae bacterium]
MNCPNPIRWIALAALALCAGCGQQVDEELHFSADAKYADWVGKPVEFQFTALDGRPVDSKQLHGKVVLLDFWATWCGPCMAELPKLKAVYERLHAQGFEIVGVSGDTDRAALQNVIQRHKLPWPQLFEGRSKSSLAAKFGIRHYPSMWLLDRQGVVRFISAGANLEEKAKKLLREGATGKDSSSEPAKPGFTNPITFAKETFEQAANRGTSEEIVTKARTVPKAKPEVKATASSPASSAPVTGIVVKGIFNSSRLQQVMLSMDGASVTLEHGQSRSVRLGGKQVRLKCDAITDRQVTLLLGEGEPAQSLTLSLNH